MSSSEYKRLINMYENVVTKVSGLYSYLGNASSVITKCKALMVETNIDGESMDKGKLDNMMSVLGELKEAFNTVLAECKLKIASYEVLYAAALRAEAKAAEKNNAVTTV